MYRMWDERYAEDGFAYGDRPNDFVVEAREHMPPAGRALCLAEGEGRNAVWLAEQGFDVVAVDQSAVGLEKAARLAKDRGQDIETVVADLATWEIGDAAYDVIVSVWAHMPPPVRAALHARCATALKPGGVFVLEAYTPDQVGRGTGGPPVPELTMTLAGLRKELVGLEVEVGRELEREVDEGKYHRGESAVVQLVARRLA